MLNSFRSCLRASALPSDIRPASIAIQDFKKSKPGLGRAINLKNRNQHVVSESCDPFRMLKKLQSCNYCSLWNWLQQCVSVRNVNSVHNGRLHRKTIMQGTSTLCISLVHAAGPRHEVPSQPEPMLPRLLLASCWFQPRYFLITAESHQRISY